MTCHTFSSELFLPHPPDLVFPFFSDARNLGTITPPWLRFEVLTPGDLEMKTGVIIDYRLRVHGLPLRWQSKITRWEPPYSFTDEQIRGPYRKWVHTHSFQGRDGGTLCGDHVEYAVPGGWLINFLLVRRDIEKIFHYRQEALNRIFPAG